MTESREAVTSRPTRRIWKLEFKWFDMWVGAFWDRKMKMLYICPLPCVVIVTWRQADYG